MYPQIKLAAMQEPREGCARRRLSGVAEGPALSVQQNGVAARQNAPRVQCFKPIAQVLDAAVGALGVPPESGGQARCHLVDALVVHAHGGRGLVQNPLRQGPLQAFLEARHAQLECLP